MTVEEIWAQTKEKEKELLQAMSLNHSLQEKDGNTQGDPTELAMVKFAKEQEQSKQVKEIPFRFRAKSDDHHT